MKKKKKLVCGIDEAGRGPVIGPMVMAGVLIREGDEKKLKEMGVKDSKLLTRFKRRYLFEKVKEVVVDYVIEILEPETIDAALRSSNLNLNWLEANTSADIIDTLKPDKAIVDCPSNRAKVYREYLRGKLKEKEVELVVEHKAERHMPVAAASIIAKEIREREIGKLKERIGNFGSGYTTDERTMRFLEKNWDKYDNVFRKSWVTFQEVLKKKFQKSLGEF